MKPATFLFALSSTALAAELTRSDGPAPLLGPSVGASVVPNEYMVVFRDVVSIDVAQAAAKIATGGSDYTYYSLINGFSATLTESALNNLRNRADVDFVEKVTKTKVHFVARPQGPKVAGEADEAEIKSAGRRVWYQRRAPWGLARISSRRNGIINFFFREPAGHGTCAYIVDTGIDDRNPEFGGRAEQLASFIKDQPIDGHGHGTFCAGIVGSKTYGVAKRTRLFGIKVNDDDGEGTVSTAVAGLNFIAYDWRRQQCPKGVVINISMAGEFSRAFNMAAAALVRRGLFVVASAGNSNMDANGTSPASEPTVCTVGASDKMDRRADFSNYGRLVNIHAPGVDITSLTPCGETCVESGTSVAAPHVAGLGAYISSLENTRGANTCRRIRQLATSNILDNVPRNTPNLLTFNGAQRQW